MTNLCDDRFLNDEHRSKVKNALPDHIELWMGETGGAYGSGKNEVTNRFISGGVSILAQSLIG